MDNAASLDRLLKIGVVALLLVVFAAGLVTGCVLHHAGHHRPPSDRRYCVLTDWLNPVLDELQIWRRVEQLLGAETEGARP